jgi:hypothetical protein
MTSLGLREETGINPTKNLQWINWDMLGTFRIIAPPSTITIHQAI